MTTLVISPHLDDAVFSVGDYMAMTDDDVTIVTVFAGVPRPRGFLSDWDREAGFISSAAAMMERAAENREACWMLGATPIDLWFAEYAYEEERAGLELTVLRTLEHLVSYLCPDVLLSPMGSTHPDHEVVARVCAGLSAPKEGYYADIPYTVHTASDDLFPSPPECGPEEATATKVDASLCYGSQLALVERMAPVLSRERIWWLT